MTTTAPVVFVVFNRPDHTRRTLEALAKNTLAPETELHIFSDGPRGPKDEAGIASVRSVIHNVEGFKQVILHESTTNKGCSKSVLSAVEHVLNLYGKCIVVEDDILTAPLFLEYMNEGLNFYENNPQIFSIGAYPTTFKIPASYQKEVFTLKRSCSWGWATWKQKWDLIPLESSVIVEDFENSTIRKAFGEQGEDSLRTFISDPEIWDLRVSYGLWKMGMMTVFPVQSFTQNIGRDGSGVHFNGDALTTNEAFTFPTRLPRFEPFNSVDESIRKAFKKFMHKPFWWLWTTRIAKQIGLYKPMLRFWEKSKLT